MWIVSKENELYHYGVPGMKWGVRRVDKLRKKAREYDKYSKEFKKEGSRRYGSDGARQTDREIEWMNRLAADNKKKSQKYSAKADALERKMSEKRDRKALRDKKSVVTYDHDGRVTGARLHDGRKLGASYTTKLLNDRLRNVTVATVTTSTAVAVGAAFILRKNGLLN